MKWPQYPDSTLADIEAAMQQAAAAASVYAVTSLAQRKNLLEQIAQALEEAANALIQAAQAETNLPPARLQGELARTCHQLRSYGQAAATGHYLHATIDTADAGRTPPRPDIRNMHVPLGPVVVFGSSNFPFAYSTAGGDVASALAAGCPVGVKAHPYHAHTSTLVAQLIQEQVALAGLPAGVFKHVYGASHQVGHTLVMHPAACAVGFTGSLAGGKALWQLANSRPRPIPVFAEMGSVNPVFVLPQMLAEQPDAIATALTASFTQGVGQFCTKPGIIAGVTSACWQALVQSMQAAVAPAAPAPMLHPNIYEAYHTHLRMALVQPPVELLNDGASRSASPAAAPTLARVQANAFLEYPVLHQEVFGPYTLLVECQNMQQLQQVAYALQGQLTTTLWATEQDLHNNFPLVQLALQGAGRVIINGVPTGVEVTTAMQHGGPYPSTTDSRFTAVGANAIERWLRPLAFQNWPPALLPPALQNANPLGIMRRVNGQFTKEALA
ncbi:MAG TPA: aldehyde dehydrogenase (NADP(+)) [Phnomibacter sp.]|nr:aldehyde dehydrogenase (NADP(+)) [Phnomibacter sp.]